MISQVLKQRLKAKGLRSFSNDNISEAFEEGDLELLVEELTEKMQAVMETLVIDTVNDHNSKDTAKRYAKMLITETFKGRYLKAPEVTEFPNVQNCDELYIVGPINLRSTCAHHHVPIAGSVWIGVLPQASLVGLSKFHRVIDHLASRPQIQEELTEQIANSLEKLTKPKGLAVLVQAQHMCCGHRGVKDSGSHMVTSVLRGEMRTDKSLKAEFLSLIELTKQ